MEQRPTTDQGSNSPQTAFKALTAPADLYHLIGRYFGSLMMFCLTIVQLIGGNTASAILFGTVGFLMQLAAIRLYRRLWRERREAEAALAAEQMLTTSPSEVAEALR